MHLVMFDIDGTLVDSAGFDSELYEEAVRSVLDVEIGYHHPVSYADLRNTDAMLRHLEVS